jgi:hypothetical protein
MPEERIAIGIDQFELFGSQLRHRMRFGPREGTPQIDEFGPSGLARYRADHYFACRHGADLSIGWVDHFKGVQPRFAPAAPTSIVSRRPLASRPYRPPCEFGALSDRS